jgi:hypothetical protein
MPCLIRHFRSFLKSKVCQSLRERVMPDCKYMSRVSAVSALEGKVYDVRIISDAERNGLSNKISNT